MFVKLFASMYEGTLRGKSDELLVFTNLLAHADQFGVIDRHWKAIADETGLPIDRVQAAIKSLSEPDKESRSAEMDGRRIYCLDGHREWGWKIVNYGKYRAIRSEEDRKEQNRLAQERWRNKQKSNNNKPRKPKSAHTEAEAEALKSTTLSGKPDVSTLNGFKSQAKEVLEFLNAKTGRSYKAVPANLEMIAARLKDGATVEELRMVIAKKTREWGGDEKMNQYLRPATLFNRVKYAQYSGELLADPKPLRVAI